MLGIGDRNFGAMHVRPLGEAVRAVGIDHHHQVDHHLVEQLLDFRALGRGEVIEQRHGAVIAGTLRPVHAMGDLNDGGMVGGRLGRVRSDQAALGGADLFKPRLIVGGGDGDAVDRPAKMATSDLGEAHPV